ncbi:MAG: cob(I)yrinic acid a,c-diamide adenosyltransferase [Planctomycetota bacterium]|jgi:cob(I)alamin adenosyltransferase
MAGPPELAQDFGLVHVLTGDGRGKTTSALGLALRAWGTGARVGFVQFVKSRDDTGEALAAAALGGRFHFAPLGAGLVRDEPSDEDREAAAAALAETVRVVSSAEFDFVVADEIFAALDVGLVARADVEALVALARGRTELVLTGRGAPDWAKALADYWTEMRDVKHPLGSGVRARRGVEF